MRTCLLALELLELGWQFCLSSRRGSHATSVILVYGNGSDEEQERDAIFNNFF